MSNSNGNDSSFDSEIFQGGFTKLPVFFVDQLIPLAAGVSAMFWKYLLIVWRDVNDPHRGFRCARTMTQFPGISKTPAIKWTAALWASCVFDVAYGRRHVSSLPGTPTIIRYRKNSTLEEWICFIEALAEALHNDKESGVDDVEGFKIELTFRLRDRRAKSGLPMDEQQKRVETWIADKTIAVDDKRCTWDRKQTDQFNFRTRQEKYQADPYRYN